MYDIYAHTHIHTHGQAFLPGSATAAEFSNHCVSGAYIIRTRPAAAKRSSVPLLQSCLDHNSGPPEREKKKKENKNKNPKK